jgi:iron complex transport system ATP-binding protein
VRSPTFRLDSVSLWRWDSRAGRRRPIVEQVTWEACAGQRWALLGPNGAGKTTLLTVLGAVEFPSSGTVDVLGSRLGRTDVFRLREQIGFVDARLGRRFAPGLTVEQVVHTGATGTVGLFEERLTGADRARSEALLHAFGVDVVAAQRYADCSHGERARALIARALMPRPPLLLLDEPGTGLDLAGRETLLAALSRLALDEPELVTVTTTHHLEELPAETTHALLLRDGRVVAAGEADATLAAGPLSACFGLPVEVGRSNGRWYASSCRTEPQSASPQIPVRRNR